MALVNKFQQGSSTYTCRCCDKQTRDTGRGEAMIDLCAQCYEEAGIENEHNDFGHDTIVKGCPVCRMLTTKVN